MTANIRYHLPHAQTILTFFYVSQGRLRLLNLDCLLYHKCSKVICILFLQIPTFIKVFVAFVFGLQTPKLIDFSRIYQLKGLKSKNKCHTNFYERCNSTKKCILNTYRESCRSSSTYGLKLSLKAES